MKKTIVEKIFSEKIGKNVKSNETVFAPVDLVMGTDGTVPLSIEIFNKMNVEKVKYPDRLVFVNDHFVPAKDISSAMLCKAMREFAEEQKVSKYFEVGRSGICHVIIPEKRLVLPGQIVCGADSHTCTYGALGAFATGIGSTDMAFVWATGKLWFKIPETIKVIVKGKLKENVYSKDIILELISKLGSEGANYRSIEFEGNTIEEMDMAGRLTISNMAVEMGAKAGIIKPDKVTEEFYLKKDIKYSFDSDGSDNSVYTNVIEIDASKLEPKVSCPPDPSNVKNAKKLNDVKLNQVVIGSCTNGRIEDFIIAHEIIKNKKINKNVRLIIIPGSQDVYKEMIEKDMASDFINSGAIISPPTCGPCIGGHMGVLAENEIGLFTTNRNFVGRNGHENSKVFLSNPAVAAQSAISGFIDLPN